MPKERLLEFTPAGIFCRQGNFFIDPWRPVDYAVITHGHSDHARPGNKAYLCQDLSRGVLHHRLGGNLHIETLPYGKTVIRNGVSITLFPAGHIVGSAQVRVSFKGEIWVVSGDYKTENDLISGVFEPVPCHTFITESTFGMPVYRWKPQRDIFAEINQWWRKNQSEGLASLLVCYALGKAQRLLAGIDASIGPIVCHGAVQNLNEIIRGEGVWLPETLLATKDLAKDFVSRSLIVCTQSAVDTPWARKFSPYSIGYCSGWMNVRGAKRRRAADRGFVLSDHADWDGLHQAIKGTGASEIFVTHGYTAVMARYLTENGLDAKELQTFYGEEEE